MKGDVYNFQGKIAKYKSIIGGLRNGEVALRMLDHLASIGLSPAAISKNAAHLVAVLRLIDFDVEKATRMDVERVVARINGNSNWKEWTKCEKRIVLRRLIQYAKYGSCERGSPVPPEVSWIKLTYKGKDSRVTPESLLNKKDFEAMVKAADNARDKALLHVLLEGALRPGELLSMSVGSVEFKDTHCLITVNGKTGLRRIPLVASYRPLLEWLEQHPMKSDPTAPLWCSLATNYKGRRLSYRHFRTIIKRMANRVGLRKDVWPYLFRHTTLTALAKVFTEARLEKYAGWVHGSKMSAKYVHFSARDLEDAVLELHGLKAPEQAVDVLKLIQCPRCREENPLGTVHCGKCGYVLDKELASKMEEEERRKDELLLKLAEDAEQLKAVVASLAPYLQAAGLQSTQAAQPSAAAPQAPSAEQPQPQTTHHPKTIGCKLKRMGKPRGKPNETKGSLSFTKGNFPSASA